VSITAHLTDPANGYVPAVDDDSGAERRALVVATRPLKTYTSELKVFTNASYGSDMAQNVTFGGSPEEVHDGTDNSYWTGSALSGTWVFNSTDQSKTGTKSIDATATANGQTAELAKGSSLSLSGYTALSGYIYLSAWDDRGTKDIELELWTTTAQVGVTVSLRDYIDIGVIGSWQAFVVTVSDFGAVGQSISAMRITTIDLGPGAAPDYYLDDLQFEETGSPLVYEVAPDPGTWFTVDTLRITMADNVASTVGNGTMPGLAYNAFLGVAALTNGIVYQRVQAGAVTKANIARQLSDWLRFPKAHVDAISDGTNTMITICMPYAYPEVLRAEHNDKLRMIVQDNLSGLLLFQVVAGGKAERRE